MDARTNAALGVVLGDSRDGLIAQLQAQIEWHRELNAWEKQRQLSRQWSDYMRLAEDILRRTDEPDDVIMATNQFFVLLPHRLFNLLTRAGYGLRAAVTIWGRNYPAGLLMHEYHTPLTFAALVLDSIIFQLHQWEGIEDNMSMESFIYNIVEALGHPV